MTSNDIIRMRLINQRIAESEFRAPEEIVSWMVAMQAQEFAMAKWSIGLRLPGLKEAAIEKAYNKGAILRTHLMRPTWHFVTPADIRWLLALTAPRVNAASAFMYRKLELDNAVFKRSNDTLIKNLNGGKQLTRESLKFFLKQKKIFAEGFRLSYLMMRAELDGIICSGARQGNQFTYALLDERAPASGAFDRESAVASIAMRYFSSRGPATIRDFTSWSGLTMKDARAGIASLSSHFLHEQLDGQQYIYAPTAYDNSKIYQTTFLMPDYDEYGMSYKDRSAIFNSKRLDISIRGNNPVFNRMIVVDGKIVGTWQRKIRNNTVVVELVPFIPLPKSKQKALSTAVKRYCLFVGKDLAGK